MSGAQAKFNVKSQSLRVGSAVPVFAQRVLLADDAIVLAVRADPKPKDPVRRVNRQRPIVRPDSHGMKATRALEMK